MPDQSVSVAAPTSVPWTLLSVLLGGTSIIVGVLWDISWHSTVGRDTFWTSAHMAIYLGGLLGGLTGGWLLLRQTHQARRGEAAEGIAILGLRAPLGAWVAMWGALAMLTSAPLDDWWHNAYGLDVEILSPPHTLLAAGIYAIAIGALLLTASWQNRQAEADRSARASGLLSSYAVGVLIAMAATFLTEYSYPNQQHGGTFYVVSAATYPFYLTTAARATRGRWGATVAAGVYMGIVILLGWILPLFPAEPLLAPIYRPLDRMVPPPFPLLLVLPAVAIDLVLRGRSRWPAAGIARAVLCGIAFLGIFLPVQWFFSGFLLSPAADNWVFFGARFYAYFSPLGDWTHRYWSLQSDPLSAGALGLALFLSVAAAGLGIAAGAWIARVKR